MLNADNGSTALEIDIDEVLVPEDGTSLDVDIVLLVRYIPIISIFWSDVAPGLGFVACCKTFMLFQVPLRSVY